MWASRGKGVISRTELLVGDPQPDFELQFELGFRNGQSGQTLHNFTSLGTGREWIDSRQKCA